MAEHPAAKYGSLGLAIVSACGAIWARFIVLEERAATQHQVIVDLTAEVAALKARVESEERATRERFHASDLRLAGIEDHVSTFVVTTTGRRRRTR